MRRDKLEITRNILLTCKNGAKKTEIVYKNNLNFKTAGVYLDWLMNKGMVLKEENLFKTTPKGDELAANLNGVSLFFTSEGADGITAL